MSTKPQLFGLIGYPLSHSFSKQYFTKKFEELQRTDCSYELFPIENIDQFPDLIKNQPNLRGLNVTIPYKEAIIPYLDEVDETAKKIGAVNTIKISNGKLIGYNTDAFGFHQSIKPFVKSHHHRALILGTGGASKAVVHVLEKVGLDCLFASRSPEGENQLHYDQINEYVLNFHQLIINTTPLGMSPNVDQCPAIPYEFITDKHLLCDLVYNPEETLFMQKGKAKGATVLNGLNMLHQQAEKAWEIWK
jgi:shikimate dehydrogenase